MAEGKFLRLISAGHWEYAERNSCTGAVTIVAVTQQEELLLVEQYRIPMQHNVIELPAGLAGDIPGEEHEALATAAQRELEEETGYHADHLIWLTSGPTTPGLSNETVAFFLATNLTKTGDGGGDASEQIIVHHVPIASAHHWLTERAAGGTLIDPKIYAGLFFWQNRKSLSE